MAEKYTVSVEFSAEKPIKQKDCALFESLLIDACKAFSIMTQNPITVHLDLHLGKRQTLAHREKRGK